MSTAYVQAINAYQTAANAAKIAPSTAAEIPDNDFASVLRTSMETAVDTVKQGERQSLAAAAGKADIQDVVMAMSKAEMTLQSVVTLRDKAVQSYQQIMRMPI